MRQIATGSQNPLNLSGNREGTGEIGQEMHDLWEF